MANNMIMPNEAYPDGDKDKLLRDLVSPIQSTDSPNKDGDTDILLRNLVSPIRSEAPIGGITRLISHSTDAPFDPISAQSDIEKLVNGFNKAKIKAEDSFANYFTDIIYGIPYGIYKSVQSGRADFNPTSMGTTILSNTVSDLAVSMNKNPNISAQEVQRIANKNIDFGIRAYGAENPFRQYTLDREAAAEIMYPNIYSQKELDRNFLQNMFSSEGWANFWGDKVIKNAGYTVGSAGAMIAGGALLRLASGMNSVKGLRDIHNISAELSTNIQAGNIKKVEQLLGSNAIRLERGLNPLLDLAKANRSKNITNMNLSAFFGANSEANMESVMAAQEFVKDRIAKIEAEGREPTQQELLDIESAKESIANSVYALNLPLLMFSNVLQFGRMIARPIEIGSRLTSRISYPTGKKLVGATASEAIRVSPTLAKKGIVSIGKDIGRILSKPVTEGLEESNQSLFSTASKEYYNQFLDADGNTDIKNILSATGKGFLKAYGTKEGWEEFGIGFIMGAMGLPMGTTKVGDKNVAWAGGIFEDVVNINKEKKEAKEFVQYFQDNPELLDKLIASYSNAVSSYKNQRTYEEAINNANPFEAENAHSNDVINMVRDAIDNGGYEVLIHKLENIKLMNNEEILNELGTNIHDDFQFHESDKQKHIDNLIQKVHDVKEISDAVKQTLPSLPKDIQAMLVFSGATIKDVVRRRTKVAERIEDMSDNVLNLPILEGTDFANEEQVTYFAEQVDAAFEHIKDKKYQIDAVKKDLDEYAELQMRLSKFNALYDGIVNGSKTNAGITALVEGLSNIRTTEQKEQMKKLKDEADVKLKAEGISKIDKAIDDKVDTESLQQLAKDYPFTEIKTKVEEEIKRRDLEVLKQQTQQTATIEPTVESVIEPIVTPTIEPVAPIISKEDQDVSNINTIKSKYNELVDKVNGTNDLNEYTQLLKEADDLLKEYVLTAKDVIETPKHLHAQNIYKNILDDTNVLNRMNEIWDTIASGKFKGIEEGKINKLGVKEQVQTKVTTQPVNKVEAQQSIPFEDDIDSVVQPREEQAIREDLLTVKEGSANLWIANLDDGFESTTVTREDGVEVIDSDKLSLAKAILTNTIKEGDSLTAVIESKSEFVDKFNAVKDDKTKRDNLIKSNTPITIPIEDTPNGIYFNTGLYLNNELELINKLIDYVTAQEKDAITSIKEIVQEVESNKEENTSEEYKIAISKARDKVNEILGNDYIKHGTAEKVISHIVNLLSYETSDSITNLIISLNKWKLKIENDLTSTNEVWDEVIKQLDNEANNDITKVNIPLKVTRKTSGSVMHNKTLTPVNEVFESKDIKIAKVDDIDNQLVSITDNTNYFNINDGRYKKRNIYALITNTPNNTFVPLPIYGMNLQQEDITNITKQILDFVNIEAKDSADFNSKIKLLASDLHTNLSNMIYVNGIKSKGKIHFKINTYGNNAVINDETVTEYPLIQFATSDITALSVVRIQSNTSNFRIEIRENKLSSKGRIINQNAVIKQSGFEYDLISEGLKNKRYNISYTKWNPTTNSVVKKSNNELREEVKKAIQAKKLGVYASKMISIDEEGNDKFVSYFKVTGNRPLILSVALDKSNVVESPVGKDISEPTVETPTSDITTEKVDETIIKDISAKYIFDTENNAAAAVETDNIKSGTIIKIANNYYIVKNVDNEDIEFLPTAIANKLDETIQSDIPLFITKDMRQQLLDLGYNKKDIGEMTADVANDIITKGTTKVKEKIINKPLVKSVAKKSTVTNPIMIEVYTNNKDVLQSAKITLNRLNKEVVAVYGSTYTKEDIDTIIKKLIC